MRSQSTIRSIAAGFLAAVLVGTLSSRPTMATPAPTQFPTGSPGYWFSDTIDGQTVGLKTSLFSATQYDSTQDGAAITGTIVTINGVKTAMFLNAGGDLTCLTRIPVNWFDCKAAYFSTYACQLVNTAFYTRPTCSPTGPLAGFSRPSPPPAAPPPPCCHLPRSLSNQPPVRLRRRGPDAGANAGPDAGANAGADGSTHSAAHS
jgi:hypothetical protein